MAENKNIGQLDDLPGTGAPVDVYTVVFSPAHYTGPDTGTFRLPSSRLTAPASANVPLLDPARTDYPFPFTVKHQIGAGVYYFGTRAAGGPFPAPTTTAGNGSWAPEAEPAAPVALFQVIPYELARRLDEDDALARGREYLITARPDSAPDVRGTFSGFAPAVIQYATENGVAGAYSLEDDTFTPGSTGGGVTPEQLAAEAAARTNADSDLDTRLDDLEAIPPSVPLTGTTTAISGDIQLDTGVQITFGSGGDAKSIAGTADNLEFRDQNGSYILLLQAGGYVMQLLNSGLNLTNITGQSIDLGVSTAGELTVDGAPILPAFNPVADEGKVLTIVGGVPTWSLPTGGGPTTYDTFTELA